MRTLIILGHPRRDSLCGALAEAYRQGAEQAGVETHLLSLGELEFDPHVREDSPEHQPLEPDLERGRAWLAWAEHLVFVYPNWWGTMPALLKGFLDRLVMPGDAFRFYGPGATQWEGLWAGKTAQLITTMDTPPPVYRWLFKAPGTHAMRNATLGFCGVKPVRSLVVGPVRTSDDAQRREWIERSRRAGFALGGGIKRPVARIIERASPWLKALRLQFYPMTWAAYTVGALTAAVSGLAWGPYLLGYLCLFCLEAATVFSNDYQDYPSDRINANHGPFTGGSRVLVDGELSFAKLRLGIGLALVGFFAAGGLALHTAGLPLAAAGWLLLALVLTLGYTSPPLKLSYRGLGEVDVAFTHSAMVLWIGYTLQGGEGTDTLPWWLATPLLLAILPAILLAGAPDRDADSQAGKRTLAVRLGNRWLLMLAGLAVVAAALLAVLLEHGGGVVGELYAGLSVFVLPHAALCLGLLWFHYQRGTDRLKRINGLLIVTLHYMVWFVAVPFYHLL